MSILHRLITQGLFFLLLSASVVQALEVPRLSGRVNDLAISFLAQPSKCLTRFFSSLKKQILPRWWC